MSRHFCAGIRFFVIVATVWGLLLWPGAGHAVESPKKLRLAYGEWGVGSAVSYVGIDGGIFKKFNITVDEMFFRDPLAGGINSLLGADIVIGFGNPLILMQPMLGGADLVLLGSHVNNEEFGMCVSTGITSLKNLRGKKVGVSALGGRSDLAARVILRRAGLDPRKDVTFVVTGFSAERVLFLTKDQIQATPLNLNLAAQAQQLGLKVLDVREVPMVASLIITTRSFVKKDEELTRRFLKAYVTAIHFYLTHRSESITILKKYFANLAPEAMEAMYESYAAQLDRLPAFDMESLQAIVDTAGADPKAAALKPRDMIDGRFLDEIKNSGYLEQLYIKKVDL